MSYTQENVDKMFQKNDDVNNNDNSNNASNTIQPLATNNQILNENDPRQEMDYNEEEQPYQTMLRKQISNDDHIGHYLYTYLSKSPLERQSLEYEIRFGTHKHKSVSAYPVTKTEYNNIIARLKAIGFHLDDGEHTLKIIASDPKVKVRVELKGLFTIQSYCKNEDLDTILQNGRDVQFTYKKRMSEYPPQDYEDFGFRVSLQEDYKLSSEHKYAKEWIDKWSKHRKRFRYMNRITAKHPNYPGIRIDLSIVKTSVTNPTYTLRESTILQSESVPRYEVEIEFADTETFTPTNDDYDRHIRNIKRIITEIMRGIQETNFPIGYSEVQRISEEYLRLVHGKKATSDTLGTNERLKRLLPKHFIGPSSISLEQKNILPHREETNTISIQKDYVVTDKADGLRKMLFISEDGRVYLVSTAMKFQFTGLRTDNLALTSSLLDGEHITHNRFGEVLNLYAIFDIYFHNKKDLRTLKFVYVEDDEETSTRIGILNAFLKEFSPKPINHNTTNHLRVALKQFKLGSTTFDIFQQSRSILSEVQNNTYDYETDGLIFTPAFEGVALRPNGKPANYKTTWNASFKWKPPEFNTVDFLAIVQQESGQDLVQYTDKQYNISGDIQPYKTLILHVGHDETNNDHGFINPCKDVLEDNISYVEHSTKEYANTYKATPFTPSNPEDVCAKICNVPLIDNQMFCEDHSVIENKTIIECRYDPKKPDGWKWIPIRIRHDKTAEFRSGIKNYGNSFSTANSVWQSIHHPVTEKMICGKEIVSEEKISEDVYYNSTGLSQTQPLRDFHNLFVKKRLILGVSHPDATLIDLAVGKGGDLPKWNQARLKFVLGIDISKDNIHNRHNGACTRYLHARRRYKNMFRGIFLEGNSSSNIRSGEACATEKGAEIVKALFGVGSKNQQTQDKLVYQFHGIGQSGFDIVSCQFALHYFFQNIDILRGFLQNVSETCKLNGYFIGTAYDGEKIFDFLKKKQKGETISYYQTKGSETHKIWEVTKQYDREDFYPDESSLGYPIDIFQETINQTFEEYLVHFGFFKEIMKEYGFELVTREQARKLSLPNGTGTFVELYSKMVQEVNDAKYNNQFVPNYGQADNLMNNAEQRTISFMNRYFVFQKVRGISTFDTEVPDAPNVFDVVNQKESDRKQKRDVIRLFRKRISHPDQYQLLRRSLQNIGVSRQFSEESFHVFLDAMAKTVAKNADITDYEIYMGYREERATQNINDEFLEQDQLNNQRGLARAKETMKHLTKAGVSKPNVYLDYGCGDGGFTRAMRDVYTLDPQNVYCTDLVKYPSLEDLQFIEQEDGISNLPQNTVDLVTCFMVLHHIENDQLTLTLKNIYNCLKPGGYFMIREHNAPDNPTEREAFQNVVDIVHDVYDYVVDTEMTWKDHDAYYSRYKSMREWTAIISKTGFKTLPQTKQPFVNRNKNNPQNKYYRIYQKPLQEKITKLNPKPTFKPKAKSTTKTDNKKTRKIYVAKKV